MHSKTNNHPKCKIWGILILIYWDFESIADELEYWRLYESLEVDPELKLQDIGNDFYVLGYLDPAKGLPGNVDKLKAPATWREF